MIEISLTDARARLPELLTKAAEGEEIHILRHGRSEAVLIGHDRWVKTKQHDILIEAREIRRQIEAARGKPLPDFPTSSDWDAEAHIAEIREGRDYDPWDELE